MVKEDPIEPTRLTVNHIENVFEAAGALLDDVIWCRVHLVDLADDAALNAICEQKVTGVKPVPTTVRADLAAVMRVDIAVIAKHDESQVWTKRHRTGRALVRLQPVGTDLDERRTEVLEPPPLGSRDAQRLAVTKSPLTAR